MNKNVAVDLIAEKYEEIMNILGIKGNTDNAETPMRVAKSLFEMTESERLINDWGLYSLELKCTTFKNQSKGIVLEQDGIEFSSMCSHHHLPFFGAVRIKYIAGDRIIGLSKFNRVVEFFSRKPQVQEDMTQEIGNFLVELLKPEFLEVEIYDCIHSCMTCRGVKSRAKTKTTFNYSV